MSVNGILLKLYYLIPSELSLIPHIAMPIMNIRTEMIASVNITFDFCFPWSHGYSTHTKLDVRLGGLFVSKIPPSSIYKIFCFKTLKHVCLDSILIYNHKTNRLKFTHTKSKIESTPLIH